MTQGEQRVARIDQRLIVVDIYRGHRCPTSNKVRPTVKRR
jgi:hypothetical protein